MAERRTSLSETEPAPERLPAGRTGAELDPPDYTPGAGPHLRDSRPGVEPDRQVNDWGRSERIEGLLDKTVSEFLYRYWFRVEVEGIDNVPSAGGALLASNTHGHAPPDA